MAESLAAFELVTNGRNGERVPAGRSGHCSVADESNIYVYGGYNPKAGPRLPNIQNTPHLSQWFKRQVMAEIWKFNFATKSWKRVTHKDSHTHKTAASACCALLPGRTSNLLVYGGTIVPWGHKMSNKLSQCQLTTGRWREVQVTSIHEEDIPPKGYGQSIVFNQGYVYVFTGAVAYVGDPVSELHKMELKSGCWTKLSPSGTPPSGRYKQEMVVYKDKLYILGGGHEWESASLEQVYGYDIDNNVWETITCHADVEHGLPRSRASFGCILVDNYIYVFGGRHYTKARGEWALNSCWKLNLDTFNWERLNVTLPIDVSFHTANMDSAGFVYLFGGIGDKQKRLNHLYRLRIFTPKLSELAWEKITDSIHNFSHKHQHQLRTMGVPENFIFRLN